MFIPCGLNTCTIAWQTLPGHVIVPFVGCIKHPPAEPAADRPAVRKRTGDVDMRGLFRPFRACAVQDVRREVPGSRAFHTRGDGMGNEERSRPGTLRYVAAKADDLSESQELC